MVCKTYILTNRNQHTCVSATFQPKLPPFATILWGVRNGLCSKQRLAAPRLRAEHLTPSPQCALVFAGIIQCSLVFGLLLARLDKVLAGRQRPSRSGK